MDDEFLDQQSLGELRSMLSCSPESRKQEATFLNSLWRIILILLSIVCMLPLMVTVIYWFFGWPTIKGFVATPQYIALQYHIAILYLACTMVLFLAHHGRPKVQYFAHYLKDLSLTLLAALFFGFTTSSIGLPLLAYWLPTSNSSLMTTVTGKVSVATVCHSGIEVEEGSELLGITPLCPDSKTARKLKVGDLIYLRGQSHPHFGIFVTELQKLNTKSRIAPRIIK